MKVGKRLHLNPVINSNKTKYRVMHFRCEVSVLLLMHRLWVSEGHLCRLDSAPAAVVCKCVIPLKGPHSISFSVKFNMLLYGGQS